MEIELKYAIRNKETAEALTADKYLCSMEEEGSREALYMKSAYFDTADKVLLRNDIAFRVRTEGEKAVASLKWNGKTEGALHTREEINVPVADEACLLKPDPAIFRESEVGKAMMKLVGEAPLLSTMEVGFLRDRFKIDTGKSILEVSVDIGEIVTDKGSMPIREVEIELFSGEQEELSELGEILAEKYELQPECRSKYARGLELLGLI